MHTDRVKILEHVLAHGLHDPPPDLVNACARVAQNVCAALGVTPTLWEEMAERDKDAARAVVKNLIEGKAPPQSTDPTLLEKVLWAVVRSNLHQLFEGRELTVVFTPAPAADGDMLG